MSKGHRKKHSVADKVHDVRDAMVHPVEEVGEAEPWDQELWEEGPLEDEIVQDVPWVEVSVAEASDVEADSSFDSQPSAGDVRPPVVGMRPERTFELDDDGMLATAIRPDRTF